MTIDDLLDKRLVILSGKGGVGKSVVAASLGLLARKHGKRTLLVEVDAPLELARYLDVAPVGHRETEVLSDLWAVNLDPVAVMDDYVGHVVKLEWLKNRIVESPVYGRFFAAAPGLKDLMVLGKILVLEEARQRIGRKPLYDLIILDAPATGHGMYLLKVPQAAADAIPFGPVGNNARRILELLRDRRRTAVGIVAIPEEMAVVEALQFDKALREDLDIEPAAVFLNACHDRTFPPDEERRILALIADGATGRLASNVDLGAALRTARHRIRRHRLAQFYERRLRRSTSVPVVTLPYLYRDPLGRSDLQHLASVLEDER